MTKEQKIEIGSILEAKIKKLEKEISEMEDQINPIGPDNAIGRISRMDAIVNQSVSEAALTQKMKDLTEMKEARTKIHTQLFGICESCQSEIEFRRLHLVPQSRRCLTCLKIDR